MHNLVVICLQYRALVSQVSETTLLIKLPYNLFRVESGKSRLWTLLSQSFFSKLDLIQP